jgi:hypothetical protein
MFRIIKITVFKNIAEFAPRREYTRASHDIAACVNA